MRSHTRLQPFVYFIILTDRVFVQRHNRLLFEITRGLQFRFVRLGSGTFFFCFSGPTRGLDHLSLTRLHNPFLDPVSSQT